MGFARVISGGPLGRYTIELDYGASTRTAILAAMDALIAKLTVKLAGVSVQIATADAKELDQQIKVSQAQAEYIAESQSITPGGQPPQATQFKFEVQVLTEMRALHAPLRLAKSSLEFDLAGARKRRAYWDAFNPIETRDAWCTDYTEDRAAGSYVATMDIPGESALILLAPGARAWGAGDGILTARELMSPEQAFFNAAILPGWQKDKPTYRWGTITVLDKEAALCSVNLFDAKSSAQRLPVNKTSALTGVPITYMECNADAFAVGDRVVIQFIGQDWDQPVVVGFLDNPKPCIPWPDVVIETRTDKVLIATSQTRFMTYSVLEPGQTGCESRWSTFSGTLYGETEEVGLAELQVAYEPPFFNPALQPLFTFEVSLPEPVAVGTSTFYYPTSAGFAQGGSPYPGGDATAFEVIEFPPKILKWSTPIAQVQVIEYDAGSNPPSTCTNIGEWTYDRLAGVPLAMSPETFLATYNDLAFFRSLYTSTVIHNGPFHELLPDPTVSVTYNGPLGVITKVYARVPGTDTFRKAPSP